MIDNQFLNLIKSSAGHRVVSPAFFTHREQATPGRILRGNWEEGPRGRNEGIFALFYGGTVANEEDWTYEQLRGIIEDEFPRWVNVWANMEGTTVVPLQRVNQLKWRSDPLFGFLHPQVLHKRMRNVFMSNLRAYAYTGETYVDTLRAETRGVMDGLRANVQRLVEDDVEGSIALHTVHFDQFDWPRDSGVYMSDWIDYTADDGDGEYEADTRIYFVPDGLSDKWVPIMGGGWMQSYWLRISEAAFVDMWERDGCRGINPPDNIAFQFETWRAHQRLRLRQPRHVLDEYVLNATDVRPTEEEEPLDWRSLDIAITRFVETFKREMKGEE